MGQTLPARILGEEQDITSGFLKRKFNVPWHRTTPGKVHARRDNSFSRHGPF